VKNLNKLELTHYSQVESLLYVSQKPDQFSILLVEMDLLWLGTMVEDQTHHSLLIAMT
jgi:hypothetical protein